MHAGVSAVAAAGSHAGDAAAGDLSLISTSGEEEEERPAGPDGAKPGEVLEVLGVP